MQVGRGLVQFGVGLAWDFPFLPFCLEGLVELCAQGFEGLLPFFPDDIDLRVVSDGTGCDAGATPHDKAVADVASRGAVFGKRAGEVGFFFQAFGAVCQQVVWIAGTHEA